MPPSIRNCSVPGCKDRVSKRFTIPTDKKCRELWLQRINNPKLNSMDPDLIRNYVVCKIHFNPYCILESDKLKKYCLPTLNIPGYVNDPDEKDLFLNNWPYRSILAIPEKPNGLSTSLCFLKESLQLNVLTPTKTYERENIKTSPEHNVEFGGFNIPVSEPSTITGCLSSIKRDPEDLVHQDQLPISMPILESKDLNINRKMLNFNRRIRKMSQRISDMMRDLQSMRMFLKKAYFKNVSRRKKLKALKK